MKTYQHIVFWILVYGILTLIFADWFEGHMEAFYYVSLLMPVVMDLNELELTIRRRPTCRCIFQWLSCQRYSLYF